MFTPEQAAKFSNPAVPVYMTAAEGEPLATGPTPLITADPAQKDPSNPNAFLVTLTPAGQAAIAPVAPPAAPSAPATPPAAPVVAPVAPAVAAAPVATPATGVGADAVAGDNISPVEVGFAPAAPKKRGGNSGGARKSAYNYDALEAPVLDPATNAVAFQSFHVAPKTGETVEKLLSRMGSNTSAANKKYHEPVLDTNGQPTYEQYNKRTFTRTEDGGYVLDAEGTRVSTLEPKTRPATKATRKFIVQKAQANDPKGAGVRVFRVELS